ncbi:MAG: DUF2125 domain-containing protein [Hyphomicrobiales bacterium]
MRHSSYIVLPTVLFFLFAAAWSVGWLYIASNAEQALDRILAQQAAAGRTLVCQNRSRSGFPFRLQFTCTAPRLTIAQGQARLAMTARQLLGMSAAFNSDQFIFELEGPIEVERTEQGRVTEQISITTKTARASLSLQNRRGARDRRVARTSLVATDISASIIQTREMQQTQASASRFAAHYRSGEDGAADIAVQLADFAAAGAMLLSLGLGEPLAPSQAELLARFTKAGDLAGALMQEAPLLPQVKAWRDRGGQVALQRLSVNAPGLQAALRGNAGLTSTGLLTGAFDATFTDPNAVFDLLVARGVLTRNQLQLAAAAVGLLAKPGPNGQGVVLPVRIVDGAVYLGPVKVARIPAVE